MNGHNVDLRLVVFVNCKIHIEKDVLVIDNLTANKSRKQGLARSQRQIRFQTLNRRTKSSCKAR